MHDVILERPARGHSSIMKQQRQRSHRDQQQEKQQLRSKSQAYCIGGLDNAIMMIMTNQTETKQDRSFNIEAVYLEAES